LKKIGTVYEFLGLLMLIQGPGYKSEAAANLNNITGKNCCPMLTTLGTHKYQQNYSYQS